MKIGVLTSSRADFGIYMPLLQNLEKDSFFDLKIIAFGSHLSKFHGYTIDEIESTGFNTIHKLSSLLTNDDEVSVATSYALTALKFADYWNNHQYDLVFCLGDRFEMAAAVQAGIPYGIRFAHIHGGETTLGAIDNVYRHQISLASKIHFPATIKFAEKIQELIGTSEHIYTVGSLSIDQLGDMPILSEEEFRVKYGITQDYVLLAFHPETVSPHKNERYAIEMAHALSEISKELFLVISMPNADTFGTIYRKALYELKEKHPNRILLIESFGKLDYFAAMHYCKFLVGNTSSGIIEAASFGKYVINVGDRQKGRLQSDNVVNIPFDSSKIIENFLVLLKNSEYTGQNVYYKTGTANSIIGILKKLKHE